MGKATNIEYGNFDFEKVYFENNKFEFVFNFELDMGCGVWGWLLMMLGDALTLFYPVLGDAMTLFYPILVVFLSKLNLNLPSLFVKITSFEVPVFEITLEMKFPYSK
jgi:hypothetical protein